MIKPVIAYSLVCDRCGCKYSEPEYDNTIFFDDDIMCEAEDWVEIEGHHYCPSCYQEREHDGDDYLYDPKPAFPDKILKLRLFLDDNVKGIPDFILYDTDDEYVMFNLRPVLRFPESLKLYIKEQLGEDCTIEETEVGKTWGEYAGAPMRPTFKTTVRVPRKNDKQ